MPKVKLTGVVIDGKRTVHAPAAVGDYDTLCCIDANDPKVGHGGLFVPLPSDKINCAICFEIWRTASKVWQSQFHLDVLRSGAAREQRDKS